MKWISKYKHPKGLSFEIEYDANVGYYVYVYNNKGENIADYLQDTFDFVKSFVNDEFNVPLNSWAQKV